MLWLAAQLFYGLSIRRARLLYYNRVGCTYSARIMAKSGKRCELRGDPSRCPQVRPLRLKY